jgi:hypothetical protein
MVSTNRKRADGREDSSSFAGAGMLVTVMVQFEILESYPGKIPRILLGIDIKYRSCHLE